MNWTRKSWIFMFLHRNVYEHNMSTCNHLGVDEHIVNTTKNHSLPKRCYFSAWTRKEELVMHKYHSEMQSSLPAYVRLSINLWNVYRWDSTKMLYCLCVRLFLSFCCCCFYIYITPEQIVLFNTFLEDLSEHESLIS